MQSLFGHGFQVRITERRTLTFFYVYAFYLPILPSLAWGNDVTNGVMKTFIGILKGQARQL